MSNPTKKLKGRPSTDDRGNSTWEWVGEDDTVDTARLEALTEGLSIEPAPDQAPPVVLDPYNQPTQQGHEKAPKRRSLDDMRRLSEEIKLEHENLVKSLRKTPRK